MNNKLYSCFCPRCGNHFSFTKNNWFFDKKKSKEAIMYCPICNFLMFVPRDDLEERG